MSFRALRQAKFASDALIRQAMRDRFTGPVIRRDPAEYRRQSVIMIRLCQNPYCRHWTPTRLKECTRCHT